MMAKVILSSWPVTGDAKLYLNGKAIRVPVGVEATIPDEFVSVLRETGHKFKLIKEPTPEPAADPGTGNVDPTTDEPPPELKPEPVIV